MREVKSLVSGSTQQASHASEATAIYCSFLVEVLMIIILKLYAFVAADFPNLYSIDKVNN